MDSTIITNNSYKHLMEFMEELEGFIDFKNEGKRLRNQNITDNDFIERSMKNKGKIVVYLKYHESSQDFRMGWNLYTTELIQLESISSDKTIFDMNKQSIKEIILEIKKMTTPYLFKLL